MRTLENRPEPGRGRRARRPVVVTTLAAVATLISSCSDSGDAEDSSSSSSSASTSSSASAGGSDVVALAEAFSESLDDDQRESLDQEYSFENAANWSNFPDALLSGGGGAPGGGTPPSGAAPSGAAPSGAAPSGAAPSGGGGTTSTSTGRVGLQTDSLSDEQWAALEELLAGVTGSAENEGFDEIVQHLAADDYLADNGGGDDYGRGNYFIAFLGTPSDSGTWELQFGGHHLAVANTYVDGELAGATPSFRGIEPMDTVEVDGVTVQPEQQERAAFSELLTSLNTEQLATATLSGSFGDILLGPGTDWAFPETAEGLAGSELTDEQKELLLAAINTYVGDIDDENAATILTAYESELDETYIGHSGSTALTEQGDYIRIDGPRVWIEFSMQNGVVLEGAHPHAVWRDEETDYAGTTS